MTTAGHSPSRSPGISYAGRLLAALVVALGVVTMHGIACASAAGAHQGMPGMTAAHVHAHEMTAGVTAVAESVRDAHPGDLAGGCLAVLGGLGLTWLLQMVLGSVRLGPVAGQVGAPRPLPRSNGPPRLWPSQSLCVIRV